MKRTILIASQNILGNTGSSRIILANIKYLTKAGHTVWTISEKCDKELVAEAGGKAITVPTIKLSKYSRRVIFSKFVDIAAKFLKPDIVWGQGENLNSDIVSMHNCVHLASELLDGSNSKEGSVHRLHANFLSEQKFKFIIANSQLMRNDLIKRYGISPDKITVIYPGYSSDQFSLEHRKEHRAALRKQLNISDDKKVIGLITSGDFKKRGITTLLKAISLVPQESRDKISIVIVGKEKNKKQYAAEAEKLGLAEQTHILPATQEVHKLYHGLDLMVHAGPIEEFGLIILEAVVCGTPVLASKGVGAMELADTTSSDFVIPEQPDAQIFANELERFVNDPNYATRWLALNRDRFVECTDNKHFRETIRFLDEQVFA
ncbi:glycosyltransferase family 4 protein [Halodesulfovibrio aestuarii]|uniref:glycosyltransferase family 4 protein n=1 Tax=Halodesulfovibrio aestuarii TaxID=126333 RepID=UPI00041D74BE